MGVYSEGSGGLQCGENFSNFWNFCRSRDGAEVESRVVYKQPVGASDWGDLVKCQILGEWRPSRDGIEY